MTERPDYTREPPGYSVGPAGLAAVVDVASPLTPGEQLVWAATFSLVLNGGSHAKLAARFATNAVDCLRVQAADPGDLYEAEVAHLQQMRSTRNG